MRRQVSEFRLQGYNLLGFGFSYGIGFWAQGSQLRRFSVFCSMLRKCRGALLPAPPVPATCASPVNLPIRTQNAHQKRCRTNCGLAFRKGSKQCGVGVRGRGRHLQQSLGLKVLGYRALGFRFRTTRVLELGFGATGVWAKSRV